MFEVVARPSSKLIGDCSKTLLRAILGFTEGGEQQDSPLVCQSKDALFQKCVQVSSIATLPLPAFSILFLSATVCSQAHPAETAISYF